MSEYIEYNLVLFTKSIAMADIVLEEGVSLTKELVNNIKEMCTKELIDFTTGETFQLKSYEIPIEFEFLSELPRHVKSEKIDYSLLEEDAKISGDEKIKSLKRINVM